MQAQSLHFLIYNDLFVLKREHEAMLGQYLVDVGRPRMPGGPRASAPCLGAPAAPPAKRGLAGFSIVVRGSSIDRVMVSVTLIEP